MTHHCCIIKNQETIRLTHLSCILCQLAEFSDGDLLLLEMVSFGACSPTTIHVAMINQDYDSQTLDRAMRGLFYTAIYTMILAYFILTIDRLVCSINPLDRVGGSQQCTCFFPAPRHMIDLISKSSA